jgi:hypothetical protein
VLAGVAGAGAFSSLAAALLTGLASAFFSSTLQFLSLTGSHLAGALAAGAGVAGAFAGSAANAVTAKAVAMIATIDFILKFPFGYVRSFLPTYI